MIRTRKLEKRDAPQAATLIRELTKRVEDPQNLISWIETLAFPRDWQFLVVEQDDGKIVAFGGLAWNPLPSKGGFVGWINLLDDLLQEGDRSLRNGLIEEVVVDSEVRGKGLGRILLRELLKLAKEIGIKRVRLATSNPVAVELYKSFGFVEEVDRDYYVLDLTKYAA